MIESKLIQYCEQINNDLFFKLTEQETENAFYAMNKRGNFRGRRGFGGRYNHRDNREGVRGGGVNRYPPTEEGTNRGTAQKVWECIYCELNSHKTVDCRKLISARNLAKEHIRR